MIPILQPPPRFWECPNCPVTDRTEGGTANRYHTCSGLAGLSAPLVPAGSRCSVTARVREDYVGSEIVQRDGDGRPIMSVVTERWDGSNDCAVFAPTAHGEMG